MPGLNIAFPWLHPFYRFIIILGIVPDSVHNGRDYKDQEYQQPFKYITTEWQPVRQPAAPENIILALDYPQELDDTKTLLLSVGLEMGTPFSNTDIMPVKYAGCAKVLAAR